MQRIGRSFLEGLNIGIGIGDKTLEKVPKESFDCFVKVTALSLLLFRVFHSSGASAAVYILLLNASDHCRDKKFPPTSH
jgi:hypothetical protein